jgi:phosphoglycerate kinase
VAHRLSELLGVDVTKAEDCVGPQVKETARKMMPAEVLLLENTRFHPEETANDAHFAEELAGLGHLYVNDAFGFAHRAHASTEGVAHYLPSVAGLLMAHELQALERVTENPERPLAVILGGAKVAEKIEVTAHLSERADLLIIGGDLANTFLKAQGHETGDSLIDEGRVNAAKAILDKSADRAVLPVDAVIADAFDENPNQRTASVDEIPGGWHIMDIGPATVDRLKERLVDMKTVIWNGPLGVTEMSPFAKGTMALARILAELDASVVAGGGDTAAAIARAGVKEKMTHVSFGGGAFLEFIEGKELPGVAVLPDK